MTAKLTIDLRVIAGRNNYSSTQYSFSGPLAP